MSQPAMQHPIPDKEIAQAALGDPTGSPPTLALRAAATAAFPSDAEMNVNAPPPSHSDKPDGSGFGTAPASSLPVPNLRNLMPISAYDQQASLQSVADLPTQVPSTPVAIIEMIEMPAVLRTESHIRLVAGQTAPALPAMDRLTVPDRPSPPNPLPRADPAPPMGAVQPAETLSASQSRLPSKILPTSNLKDSAPEWISFGREAMVPSIPASAINPAVLTPSPPLLPPQQLAQSIIHCVGAGGDGLIELTLKPEELGHVRFDITSTGDRLTVVLFVERPEAMDLFRRHGEQLLNELRLAGFTQPSLSFGDWSQRNARSGASPPRPNDTAPPDINGEAVSATSATQRAAASGRLDMRL
ncbi:MAG: flagellar hook-length control protein FliK [Paracoccaceae bacterium]